MRSTKRITNRPTNRRFGRRGGAVVEMAVVSPLLLMIVFGIIEFGYVFMVQQTITNGIREACRVAALPGATDQDVRDRFQQAIAPTGLQVTPGMLVIDHASVQNPVVSVRVSVPYRDVSLLGVLPSGLFQGWFCGGGGSIESKTLGSSCSMHKEGSIPTGG